MAKLQRFARQISSQLAKGKPPAMSQEMLAHIDQHVDEVFISLEGFVEHLQQEGSQAETLATAYLGLMSVQLEHLRYRIDRNYDWANGLLEKFQQRIVSLARDGVVPGPALSAVAGALREAKLPPSPELVAIHEELIEAEETAAITSSDIESLFENIAKEHGNDVFLIADTLAQTSHAMTAEYRAFLAGRMADCPIPAIREAAALAVLDSEKEARRGVALSLRECAGTLTPTALRRLIVMRNWLPEGERHLIDQVVRAARTKGVDCAPWDPGGTVEIRASAIDGSGAQGLLAASQEGKRYRLSSVLLKQDVGVLDAWSGERSSKRQIAQTFEEASDSTPFMMVSRGYLDQAVCHHLAIGLEDNSIPPVGLIQVAETTRAINWQPSKLDWREELNSLVGQLSEHLLEPAEVTEILATSDEWAWVGGLSDSWFEDDQEVENILVESRIQQVDELAQRVLHEIVEKRKLKWAERFLWLALWLKEGPPDLLSPWPQFIILAQELSRGRSVREIPLMEEIALTTVMALRGEPTNSSGQSP